MKHVGGATHCETIQDGQVSEAEEPDLKRDRLQSRVRLSCPRGASSNGESLRSDENLGVCDQQECLEASVVLCQIKSGRAREEKVGSSKCSARAFTQLLALMLLLDGPKLLEYQKEEQSCTRTISGRAEVLFFCKTSGLDFSRRETTLQAQIDRSIFLKQKARGGERGRRKLWTFFKV